MFLVLNQDIFETKISFQEIRIKLEWVLKVLIYFYQDVIYF